MRILGEYPCAVVLLLFFFIFMMLSAPSKADIISTKIRSHNRDIILFSHNFAFAHTGYVSVAVSSVVISTIPVTSNLSRLPDPSRIGFFLVWREVSYRYSQELERNPDLCALDVQFISVLFTFRDLSPPPNSSFNNSYNVTYPGEYSIYFANCNDLSLVTMDVRTELYNTGTTTDYLSALQTQPSVYLKFLVIYLCLLGFWICVSIMNWQYLEKIHLEMGVLIVMNLIQLICVAVDQHDLKVTGTHHDWHHVLFYSSHCMRDVYFFTIIVLIGAGWCNWRQVLPESARYMKAIVILLRCLANLCFIGVDDSGPYKEDWWSRRSLFFIAGFFSCIVVFVHSLCELLSFKEATATDASSFVRSYSSFKGVTCRHNVFPFLVLVYIYFTTGLNDIHQTSQALETTNLVFSLVMFYMYRPFNLDNHQDQKSLGFLHQTAGV